MVPVTERVQIGRRAIGPVHPAQDGDAATTVGVCPEMSATTRMASTRRRVSSPTSRTCGVPALPDTSPPFRRVPVVEDLATAADVLSEVERDEQRRGERSFPNGPSRGVDPALADLGNRRHTHGDTD